VKPTLSLLDREAIQQIHQAALDLLQNVGVKIASEPAEAMLRESLAMNIELLGREHRSVARSMALLANCLIASGRYEEALSLAVEAREIYVAVLPEDHWRTAVAIGAEGAALAGQSKYVQAEPLLLRSHSVLSQDPSAQTRYVDDATRRLASLYSEWGKPERAAEYLAMAEE